MDKPEQVREGLRKCLIGWESCQTAEKLSIGIGIGIGFRDSGMVRAACGAAEWLDHRLVIRPWVLDACGRSSQ